MAVLLALHYRSNSLLLQHQLEQFYHSEILDILKETNFIGSVNQNHDFSLQKPQEVYFLKEKLKMWFELNEEDEIYGSSPD